MSLTWTERKDLLGLLLQARGDDDEGLALDRILHGQNAIGKTSKTIKIDSLRFTDNDLVVFGTLDHGQFGVVDVVNCVLDGRVYVRKSIERTFALRTREQCSPQFERDILLFAKRNNSIWAPHLLCAFQTSSHLNLVMDYAQGGTLWDVLESSPHDGRVLEADLRWWAPQAVCAIHWCHSQGFAHRDVKPHNFVLTSSFHLQLIDFGSAAPLLPPEHDGSQNIPQRYSLVPCGTCDYISPEILQAHEDALLALELSDQNPAFPTSQQQGSACGLETDWWSFGVMLYELLYGVAPFFASDVRTTYLRVMDHETSLRFNKCVPISDSCRDLLQRLLTNRERRLGRRNVLEITEHPFFKDTHWSAVGRDDAPPGLHVPHFTNTSPAIAASCGVPPESYDESHSQPFAFSTLFQSSFDTSQGLSILRSTPHTPLGSLSSQTEAAFLGFSWGPPRDAFPLLDGSTGQRVVDFLTTPRPLLPLQASPHSSHAPCQVSSVHLNAFATPVRPHNVTLHHTLPRTNTIRRTAMRRAVSDREAMKQLVDCIGMSARKKVLASGRKPRILDSLNKSRSNTVKKELRFGPPPIVTNRTYDSVDFPPVVVASESEGTESGSEGPPSPSPSPRPGSAMSMLSRRSATPTTTGSHSTRFLSLPSSSLSGALRETEYRDQLSDWDDKVISELEDRHTVLISELCNIQLQLDYLRAL
ncbi:kinase-like protein [Gyrodon lividus]|nr:kinase-like protein [Gyrodon lividus]